MSASVVSVFTSSPACLLGKSSRSSRPVLSTLLAVYGKGGWNIPGRNGAVGKEFHKTCQPVHHVIAHRMLDPAGIGVGGVFADTQNVDEEPSQRLVPVPYPLGREQPLIAKRDQLVRFVVDQSAPGEGAQGDGHR